MINKKILAVAIASAFTFSANAAPIDLDDSDTALVYASETIADGGDIATNAALDLTFATGLNLPASTTFYVRVEISNAVLVGTLATPDTGLINIANNTAADTVALEGGGVAGDDYLVYSYEGTGNIDETDNFTLSMGTNGLGLTVTDTSMPVTFTYKLYQAADSLDALNGSGSSEVTSTTLAGISFATGQDVAGSFAATNLTALVSSQFTEFADGVDALTANDTITAIGKIAYAVDATKLAASDSAAVDIADVYTASSVSTLTGDFSFGTWTFNSADDCTGTSEAVTIDEDKAVAYSALADFTTQYLCVDVSGLADDAVIPKVTTAYSVSLDDNEGVTGSLGTIAYDTTAIKIPFITTNENSNMKFYIVNSGGTAASFTTSFVTETAQGITVDSVLDGSSGEVPANGMLRILAKDMVEFAGGTRGSATIEIEAEASAVQATSVFTNLVSKGSDVTILTVE
jgi:hypothetical protein